MQVAALNILAAALGRGDESLSYLYQEHSVSQFIHILYSMLAQLSLMPHNLLNVYAFTCLYKYLILYLVIEMLIGNR